VERDLRGELEALGRVLAVLVRPGIVGARQRRGPLRKLFAEIPTVLQALKPCFLMSLRFEAGSTRRRATGDEKDRAPTAAAPMIEL
jgi:hypothetical protein